MQTVTVKMPDIEAQCPSCKNHTTVDGDEFLPTTSEKFIRIARAETVCQHCDFNFIVIVR